MWNNESVDNGVKIKVIGVGGGGNNAVIHIINENVKNIEPYLINTEHIYLPHLLSLQF